MAALTIAGLTIREAARRRTLIGAFVLGLLVVALSLLVTVIQRRLGAEARAGRLQPQELIMRRIEAQAVVTSLCLSAIKCLGGLFAVMIAGGAISSEIERGLLTVIVTKPIRRWQILLGRWLGLNVVLMGSVFVWTVMAWFSLSRQTGRDFDSLLTAALYLSLFPLVVSTLTLTLSTFAGRMFGTALALALVAFAWFDGILNALAAQFNVDSLRGVADFASLVVPQGYIGFWVEAATDDVLNVPVQRSIGFSSNYLVRLGAAWHIPHLDAIYVALYVVVLFLVGAIVFQRRDV